MTMHRIRGTLIHREWSGGCTLGLLAGPEARGDAVAAAEKADEKAGIAAPGIV